MMASDVLKKTTRKLWTEFLRLDVVKNNTYNAKCELPVIKRGPACTLEVHCTHQSQRCNGRSWQDSPMSNPQGHSHHLKTYDINKQSILCTHHLGMGWVDMCHFFSLLGICYMGQGSYENTEKHVGEVLVKMRDDVLRDAMEEEKRLTQETYFTEEHGEQPGCTFGLDMGWNKRGSGRTYNSATGTLLSVGLKTKKICDAITLCNRCSPCNKLERVKNKKEKAIKANKKRKISKYSLRETKLAKHLCLKTWDKSSKSMESEAIIRFVLNAPSKSG